MRRRRWGLHGIAFGIKRHMKRQGNLQHEYSGNDCLQLKGHEAHIELASHLEYLKLCMFYSKKSFSAFLKFGGYNQDDVLIHKARARLMQPSFALVRDEKSKCFLLFIRGAISTKERLTAATAAEVPFHHIVLNEGKISNVVLGYAHCGMLAAARWIANLAIPHLHNAVREFPDYQIKVTGHSMGAGIGAILAYILLEHHEFSSCTCLAFATGKLLLHTFYLVEHVMWNFLLIVAFIIALRCHFEILIGSGFGYWIVRRFILSKEGSVGAVIARCVKWAMSAMAIFFVMQSTLDPFRALVALAASWRVCFVLTAMATNISSPSFVGRLFHHAFENSRSNWVLVHSLSGCISLLDPKRLVSASYQVFHSRLSHGTLVTSSPETVNGMLDSLGDLLKFLDVSSAENVLPTTYGSLQPPLGKHCLKIVEFISVLLSIGSEAAEVLLIHLGAIKRVIL